MKLRQLEAIHAVLKAGSMTDAARLLNVTQPAISALVANFEKDCGFQLFFRKGKQLEPTPEAVAIFADIADVFRDLEEISFLAEELTAGSVGHLRISASAPMANGILAQALATFLKDRPKVTAELLPLTSSRVVDSVLSREADFGIAVDPAPNSSMSEELLFSAAIECVMASDHPLATQKSINASDLQQVPLITYLPQATLRTKIEAAFVKAGIVSQPRIEVNRSLTGMMLARWSNAIALIEPYLLKAVPIRGIVTLPLEPRINLGVYVVWHKSLPRSAMTLAFIEHLKATINIPEQ